MQAPRPPRNEPERLEALLRYRVLDSAPEAAFDNLTALAASVLDVPIVLVSLIDESRQWFKSAHGLSVRETPREISFCGHVVETGQPLLISDARKDPRFFDNPLVTPEPLVCAYAGIPLTTSDGFVLGTFCAIDHAPRSLSPAALSILEKLAGQAVALLELRRTTFRLAEEHKALEIHRRMFEHSVGLLCTVNPRQRFELVSPSFEQALGFSKAELLSRPFLDFVHPDDLAVTLRESERVFRGAVSVSFENRYRRKDGSYIVLSWAAAAHENLIFASARDVTIERENEAALIARDQELEESEARLRNLFDGMLEGVVLQDARGAIIQCNPSAETILGLSRDQLLGRTSVDPRWGCIHPDFRPFPGEDHPAMVSLRTGLPQTGVTLGVRKVSGELTWIAVNSRPIFRSDRELPISVITTFRDITEEFTSAQLARHLTQQERLITTGTLAAGVGHEVNNPLAYIITNLDYAVEELRMIAGGSPSNRLTDLIASLSEAKEGAERIRKIVRGLRSLAREDSPPVPSELAPIVDVSIKLAMHELRQKASVAVRLPKLDPIVTDESRLTQVLVNLLVNAGQAFTDFAVEKNQVTISAVAHPSHIELLIADNGPGIHPEILPRIFDPFFTTKPLGIGTGLGLSISHSIITSLGGRLRCTTKLREGTVFHIELPYGVESVVDPVEETLAPPSPRARLLFVDDEETLLRSYVRVLKTTHEVIATTDGRKALQLLLEGERFDGIFCDLMMPHLNGYELFERLSLLDPEQARRVVFMSGGVVANELWDKLALLPNARLEKPFSIDALRAVIKQLSELP